MQFRRDLFCWLLLGIFPALFLAACSPSAGPEEHFNNGAYEFALVGFQARADAGDAAAINYLGVHYYLGLGVDRDLKLAAHLFERAAIEGHRGAQRNLGIMYLRGLGVPQDKVRAYSWFYQSAEQGDVQALKYRDYVADQITPNQSIVARRWVTQTMRDVRS